MHFFIRIQEQIKAFFKLPRWFVWPVSALVLFRIFTILRLDLIDDEAYHWTWAKNLNWSYFDHPGMVGWVIWPFINIFGDSAVAIRTPGFLLFLGILFLVYKCGKEIFDQRTGLLAALLVFLIPLWGFASLGTLPDGPLAFFWMLVLYFFWQTVRPDEKRWSLRNGWLLIGIAMGLGMNSKLACCLIGLGMGLYLLLTPALRKQLLSPWPYVAVAITFAMMFPIFWWNSQHDWWTFRYQFMNRHNEDAGTNWTRWFQFWAIQWLFMSPGVYFTMLVSFIYGAFRFRDLRWRFIWCLAFPSLAIFYYQALKAAYKPHWSGPSYLILLLGATFIFWNGLQIKNRFWIQPKSKWLAGISLAFLLALQLLFVPLFTPIIPKIFAKTSPQDTWVPKNDFSNEFYGWKAVGEKVRQMQKEQESKTGQIPFIAAQRYELISQLTWGAGEKVWTLANETNQFLFDQIPDRPQLYGRSALIVNNDKYPRDPRDLARFDACEKTEFPFYRDEILARTFYIYLCRNFQGFVE